jgi:hypothetical protein
MKGRARKPIDWLLPFEGISRLETKRTKFLDAIDCLKSEGSLCDDDLTVVDVIALQLPSRDYAYLVVINSALRAGLSVKLPTCSAIRAADTFDNRLAYSPNDFDKALLDCDGNVTLANGLHLHACEVVPMKLPTDWGLDRDDVVRQAMCFMGAEQKCVFEIVHDFQTGWIGYLPIGDLSDRPEHCVLGQMIDYGAVAQLAMETEKLEAFVAFHESHPFTKRRYSRQTLANILRDAGIRIPLPEGK